MIDELNQTQDALFDLNQQVKAVGDRVERTTIRAPTGFIFGVGSQHHRSRYFSEAGDSIYRADIDRLVVRAQLSPMDIDRGSWREAEVRFSVLKMHIQSRARC